MKRGVTIVTIARNEVATIAGVISETRQVCASLDIPYEILVNDDASTDGTGTVLDALARHASDMRVFHQKTSLGIARGTELLYHQAKMPYVFILPGDGQYLASDLPKMLAAAERTHAAVVVGVRMHKQYDLVRLCVSWLFNMLPYLLFHVRTYDAGSIKLFQRVVLSRYPPLSTGVFGEAERLIRMQKHGHRIVPVPIHHRARVSGRATGAKLSLIGEACIDLIRVWRQFH